MTIIQGIVIKERLVGESDKFIDVLTAQNGVIEISVKGGRKITAKNSSSAQLFAYSKFCVQVRKDRYFLNSAEPIHIFYNLRNDLSKISLASYFADIIKNCVFEQNQKTDILRLFLNTLHYLENDLRSHSFLKSLFELRFVSEIGLMPDVLACTCCGDFEPSLSFFYIRKAHFCCSQCFNNSNIENDIIIKCNPSHLHTIRHITLSDFDRLYNFKISDKIQSDIAYLSETYLIEHVDKNFKTLDFYKSISI